MTRLFLIWFVGMLILGVLGLLMTLWAYKLGGLSFAEDMGGIGAIIYCLVGLVSSIFAYNAAEFDGMMKR